MYKYNLFKIFPFRSTQANVLCNGNTATHHLGLVVVRRFVPENSIALPLSSAVGILRCLREYYCFTPVHSTLRKATFRVYFSTRKWFLQDSTAFWPCERNYRRIVRRSAPGSMESELYVCAVFLVSAPTLVYIVSEFPRISVIYLIFLFFFAVSHLSRYIIYR